MLPVRPGEHGAGLPVGSKKVVGEATKMGRVVGRSRPLPRLETHQACTRPSTLVLVSSLPREGKG